ncbi:proline-rich receptor-like protein kinase PERK2 [Iris pallida]|uniref:Proline-rich receptor-like protein kinase PERK2 n=1 Tax=Iris pallida TaxID=29817 RepID=A0AAX6HQL6_IRIPA|nr:proline-rich receptor-like protein kinase PERK2 [Iris pallida]
MTARLESEATLRTPSSSLSINFLIIRKLEVTTDVPLRYRLVYPVILKQRQVSLMRLCYAIPRRGIRDC